MGDAERKSCYDKALDLLARAEHCRWGLERKLRKKEFSKETVNAVLDRLEDETYLNDKRYAELWVDFRLRSHKDGGRLLEQNLVARGIDRPLAEQVVASRRTQEIYTACLRRVYEAALRRGLSSEIELRSRLFQRGFSSSEIRDFFEERG
jgi:regulatory protein